LSKKTTDPPLVSLTCCLNSTGIHCEEGLSKEITDPPLASLTCCLNWIGIHCKEGLSKDYRSTTSVTDLLSQWIGIHCKEGLSKKITGLCVFGGRGRRMHVMLHVFLVMLQETWTTLHETCATLNKTPATLHASAVCRIHKADYRSTTSVTDLLSQLKWDSLQKRRCASGLVVFHKAFHGQSSISLGHLAKPSRSNRQSATFVPLQCHTDVYKFSFFPRTIRDWNLLPPDLQSFSLYPASVLVYSPCLLNRSMTPRQYEVLTHCLISNRRTKEVWCTRRHCYMIQSSVFTICHHSVWY